MAVPETMGDLVGELACRLVDGPAVLRGAWLARDQECRARV